MLSRIMKRLHAPVYAARLAELVRRIIPHLRESDRLLDVGCGTGTLGRAILDAPGCPPGVTVLGLERIRRQNEAIEVHEYDGVTIPHPDDSFDVVILADVLHHEPDPHRLIQQCIRVSRRLLIIKDHRIAGPLAHPRIALLDWAANAPYGVPCLYRYNTPSQWRQWLQQHRLETVEQLDSMRLYPPMYNWFFGGRLQYFAVLRVPEAHDEAPSPSTPGDTRSLSAGTEGDARSPSPSTPEGAHSPSPSTEGDARSPSPSTPEDAHSPSPGTEGDARSPSPSTTEGAHSPSPGTPGEGRGGGNRPKSVHRSEENVLCNDP